MYNHKRTCILEYYSDKKAKFSNKIDIYPIDTEKNDSQENNLENPLLENEETIENDSKSEIPDSFLEDKLSTLNEKLLELHDKYNIKYIIFLIIRNFDKFVNLILYPLINKFLIPNLKSNFPDNDNFFDQNYFIKKIDVEKHIEKIELIENKTEIDIIKFESLIQTKISEKELDFMKEYKKTNEIVEENKEMKDYKDGKYYKDHEFSKEPNH
jgi:hypothetical protein